MVADGLERRWEGKFTLRKVKHSRKRSALGLKVYQILLSSWDVSRWGESHLKQLDDYQGWFIFLVHSFCFVIYYPKFIFFHFVSFYSRIFFFFIQQIYFFLPIYSAFTFVYKVIKRKVYQKDFNGILATHNPKMDRLCKSFVKNGFDLKKLAMTSLLWIVFSKQELVS